MSEATRFYTNTWGNYICALIVLLISTSLTCICLIFKGAMAWYVVYRRKQPGVYATWATCHAQVNRFPSSCYKRFPTQEEAVASLLEFKGCEDEKILVHPPTQAISKPKPVLFVVVVVQSLVLLVLIWLVLSRCYNCLWWIIDLIQLLVMFSQCHELRLWPCEELITILVVRAMENVWCILIMSLDAPMS